MRQLKILFLVLLISNFHLFAFDSTIIKKSTKADLDGDGRLNKISLSVYPDAENPSKFILKINSVTISGLFDSIEDSKYIQKEFGMKIIDINKYDKFKEIVIFYDGGRYDLKNYHLYSFDGHSIQKMLDPIPMLPKYKGNGIVLVDQWRYFWTKREKYILNPKTRKLDIVPQELYYVGVEARVKVMFPIYKTKSGSKIMANLKPKSIVLILAYNTNGWYLIKCGSGLIGWTNDLSKLALPTAG